MKETKVTISLDEEVRKSVMDKLAKGEISKDEAVEELKKAVTSEAAPAENGPENDEQLNGEAAPTIQDATTPSELKAEDAAAPEAAKIDEPVQTEVPEGINADQAQGGKTQEISFGNMFGDTPYQLGATLEQAPEGNVMTNMKKPDMDYVERAKEHGNQKLTDKDFQKKDEQE